MHQGQGTQVHVSLLSQDGVSSIGVTTLVLL